MQADDMKSQLQSTKLTELRAKTDRQLALLIDRRLDAGLRFVRRAYDCRGHSQGSSEAIFQASASRAYDEASKLMPWIDHTDRPVRLGLEFKLEQLRRGLSALSVREQLQAQTA